MLAPGTVLMRGGPQSGSLVGGPGSSLVARRDASPIRRPNGAQAGLELSSSSRRHGSRFAVVSSAPTAGAPAGTSPSWSPPSPAPAQQQAQGVSRFVLVAPASAEARHRPVTPRRSGSRPAPIASNPAAAL
ncbi:unnamed protein product, partial [Polarella glacialis]